MIDVLNTTQQQLRMTKDPEIYLEVATGWLSETAKPVVEAAPEPAVTPQLEQLSAKEKQLSEELKRE